MEEHPVRLRDIAEELGLSTATVSNVLHGKTQKVSDETVRRVQRALEERRYIPSMAGVLLAQNDSRIVGVFINDHEKYEGHTLSDGFIASSLDHLSTEIEARGLFMMVKKAKQPEEVLHFASMWNMDGLVMLGFCRQDYVYLRDHMRIPFVVYDGSYDDPHKAGQVSERIVNITIDDFDGGRQMGEHFRQLGHRRALCLSDNDTGVDAQRIAGFRAGFGGTVESLLLPMHATRRQAFYRDHLAYIRSFTAVFAVSDYYALDLIRSLQESGLSVPQDISVAGFDDSPLCQLVWPPLTTVRQDGALRARLALEQLYALRQRAPQDTVPVAASSGIAQEAALQGVVSRDGTITLPVTLIPRATTRRI